MVDVFCGLGVFGFWVSCWCWVWWFGIGCCGVGGCV